MDKTLAVDLVVHVTRPTDSDIVGRSKAGTLLDPVQALGRREASDSMKPLKVTVCPFGRIGPTIGVSWNLGHGRVRTFACKGAISASSTSSAAVVIEHPRDVLADDQAILG
jgi:hypothetical protein